jgi:hypothetical protein
VRDLVDDANVVLAPSLGARLEIETMSQWDDAGGDRDAPLESALEELRAKDAGDGADWVIGMVGGLSRLTPSFHELGMGEMAGKHLVVRAASKADEHDAVDKAFDELGEEERARLRRSLKRHRAVAVFLHELGHTLGALHERDARSLMHPRYDRRMTAFSPEAIALMRITLTHRDPERTTASDAHALDEQLLAHLREATDDAWVPNERAQRIAQLDAALASATPPAASPAPAPAPARVAPPEPLPDLPGLTDADRALFARARESLHAGDAEAAWAAASPLFKAHPTSYAVQDLRCQIAMHRNLAWPDVRAECDPLMLLSKQGRH